MGNANTPITQIRKFGPRAVPMLVNNGVRFQFREKNLQSQYLTFFVMLTISQINMSSILIW